MVSSSCPCPMSCPVPPCYLLFLRLMESCVIIAQSHHRHHQLLLCLVKHLLIVESVVTQRCWSPRKIRKKKKIVREILRFPCEKNLDASLTRLGAVSTSVRGYAHGREDGSVDTATALVPAVVGAVALYQFHWCTWFTAAAVHACNK